ncbi:MAG: cell division protein [Bacteroidota bacterium]
MSRRQKQHILVYSSTGLVLALLIGIMSQRHQDRKIDGLNIDVKEQEGVYFTDDLEVTALMIEDDPSEIFGAPMRELNPKELEHRVETNPFVKEAQVFRDLKGQLKVEVEQSKPLARVFTNGKSDLYIDTDGRILPVNAKYTARVPLLETDFEFGWNENLQESAYGTKILDLLSFIDKDDFWRAQIAHLLIKKDGEIVLLPQVTKQMIEFGKPENFQEKFSKLMTFYKEILPKKGWNHYERVNLKFKDQIICE